MDLEQSGRRYRELAEGRREIVFSGPNPPSGIDRPIDDMISVNIARPGRTLMAQKLTPAATDHDRAAFEARLFPTSRLHRGRALLRGELGASTPAL